MSVNKHGIVIFGHINYEIHFRSSQGNIFTEKFSGPNKFLSVDCKLLDCTMKLLGDID